MGLICHCRIMSSAPKALQRLADAAMYGKEYRDTGPLWAYLKRSHSDLADKVERQPPRGANPDKLVQRLRDAMKSMRQAKKRGTWKPSRDAANTVTESRSPPTKTNALPPRKPRQQNPDLAKTVIVGAEEMLWQDNGNDGLKFAVQIDVDDLTSTSTGFAVVSPGDGGQVLDRFFDEEPFDQPFALVFRKTCDDSLMAKHNRHVRERYTITEASLYFTESEGKAPIKNICYLVQLGNGPIIFKDMTHKVVVQGPVADKIRVSIQLPNITGADDFNTDHRAKFAKAALAAINPKLLYKDSVPFWTRTITDFVHKGKTMARHDGFVDIAADKLDEAWRRSGIGEFNIRAIGKEPFVPIHLPPATTSQEARAKAQLLDSLAFGVVTTRNGYAIRVLPEHRVQADKILNPEYTELIGDALLTLPKGDGLKIEIVGVPRHMDNATLVRQLTMTTLTEPWKCKPTGTIKSTTYGRKTVLAIAATMPPRTNVQVDIAGELFFVTIRQHTPPKNQMTHWDKIGKSKECESEFPSLASRSASLGAKAKAQARTVRPSAWNRIEEEDDERFSGMSVGQVYALREQEAAANGCPINDDDVDDDDDDGTDMECGTTQPAAAASSFPRTKVARSTIPAAPPAKDSLLERLMIIKKDSDNMRKESDERHNRAQEQFEAFQRDVDTKMTVIGDTLVVLKESIQGNNQQIDDRMAKTESAIVNLAGKLDQMFAVFEQKWSNPSANSTSYGWGQQSWDQSTRWHDVEDKEEEEQEEVTQAMGGPSTEAPRDNINY